MSDPQALLRHFLDDDDRNPRTLRAKVVTHVGSIRVAAMRNASKRGAKWSRAAALRNAFEHRWALALGLTIEELCTIYRTQFLFLRDYECNTWYDQKGHFAFTHNPGLTGVGLECKDFELWLQCLRDGTKLPKDFDKHGLVPPFEVGDREKDMALAYGVFTDGWGTMSCPDQSTLRASAKFSGLRREI
jgi:hypothetical protein